jgi:Rps23 Pro-64 3,4-dihydroxylase Tpa1-like proline 4-hydroxylase
MTSKQVLDAFSEALMQDERILSPRERELLTSLLQNARAASDNPETQLAVNVAIARSVGETVAQRAFALLGSSFVEKIVARSVTWSGAEGTALGEGARLNTPTPTPPQPPSPTPPVKPPQPPSDPQPTGRARADSPVRLATRPSYPVSRGRAGVLEEPAAAQTHCVVLDEFLAPHELDDLIRYALSREAEFRNSEVISPDGEAGATDYSHRRSRVLMDLGPHEELILTRIRKVLPRVLEQMGIEEFPVARTEMQITASNDGDFFHAHCDDSEERVVTRRMTFVYFFHREPNGFEGGELRLHDSRRSEDHPLSAGCYEAIKPRQNQIVFFPCSTLHEITAVRCRSQAFADSRFTANGWLHQ